MTNFDDGDDLYGYPFPPIAENPDLLLQFSLTQAAGATNPTFDNWGEHWGLANQPNPTTGSSTNILGLAVPATSHPTQSDDDIQQLYAGEHSLQYLDQFQFDGNWDTILAEVAALEVPEILRAPSSNPLCHWGDNQSGLSVGAPNPDAHIAYHSNTSVVRTEENETKRFQPYTTRRSRSAEHENAEAGPPTLKPSRIPPVGPPTKKPSGGILSETTADADNDQKRTEEDKASVPDGQKKKKLRKERVQFKADGPKLRQWARWWKGLRRLPSLEDALAVAAEVIPTVREAVHQEPCLRMNETEEAEEVEEAASKDPIIERKWKDARVERVRRGAERSFYQELSRYYLPTKRHWTRPQLLSKVVEDLETHPDLKWDV